MRYIIYTLIFFTSFGCVRSTAEWVVSKTSPTTQIEDNNTTNSSGVIFNEKSEDSWYVLISIGSIIFIVCVLIPFCVRLDFSKIKNYFLKKDT